MQVPRSLSRREFMWLSGLAAGSSGLALSTIGRAADPLVTGRDTDAVLDQLFEGNKRFMKGELAPEARGLCATCGRSGPARRYRWLCGLAGGARTDLRS